MRAETKPTPTEIWGKSEGGALISLSLSLCRDEADAHRDMGEVGVQPGFSGSPARIQRRILAPRPTAPAMRVLGPTHNQAC